MKPPMLLLLAAACGCSHPKTDDSAVDDSPGDDTSGDSHDTAPPTPVGPCAEGAWGSRLAGPDGVIVVSQAGDDAAAGAWDSPVASLAAALERAVANGATAVLIGPGSFPTSAVMDSTHDGIAVYGCGADVTTLVDPDPLAPATLLRVNYADGVTLADFATSGGKRAIEVDVRDTNVTLSSLALAGGVRSGLLVYGYGEVTMDGVDVSGVSTDGDDGSAYGYGMSFVGSSPNAPLSISMEGGIVDSATTAGVLGDQAALSMSNVSVTSTQSNAGYFGRGVQVQNGSSLWMSGCWLDANADAAVYAVGSPSIEVMDSDLLNTLPAALPDDPEADLPPGDGLVVRVGDHEGLPLSAFILSITRNVIDGNGRTGILVEDATVVEAEDNTGTNGYAGGDFIAQGAANVDAVPDAGFTSPDTELEINVQALGGGN